VEKAADCLEDFEQEALAAQQEEEKNKEVSHFYLWFSN